MRSLFFKVFLWFWATQILIGAALYALAVATQRGPDERLRAIAGDSLTVWARAAAIAYERGGPDALREAWRLPQGSGKGLEERRSAALYVAKSSVQNSQSSQSSQNGARQSPSGGGPDVAEHTPDSHSPVAGPAAPPATAAIIAGALHDGQAALSSDSGSSWVARLIETPSGGRYVAVVRLRPNAGSDPLRGWRLPIPDVGLRLLVVALTMGAVCYTLALYLASPARTLSDVTRRFADGDLSARVGPRMGRRRDELADLGRDFDLMAGRIEALMMSERDLAEAERRRAEAQRRLLADISHELRSPLARIAYALDLAEGSPGQGVSPDAPKYLQRIQRESGRLNELIGQLLTLARLEGDGDLAGGTPFDLARLVLEVAEDADFEAQSRGCHVRAEPIEPCRAEGAPDLLRSAIENVVRNAVRYTRQGTNVEVSLHRLDNEAVICVRDYGPGVPEASLGELFRPFYRVEDARDRQSGGTGLGLSIAERAVRRHGGSVRASNAPGGGLIVEIRLTTPGHAAKIA